MRHATRTRPTHRSRRRWRTGAPCCWWMWARSWTPRWSRCWARATSG